MEHIGTNTVNLNERKILKGILKRSNGEGKMDYLPKDNMFRSVVNTK
jgi:hypothetical protein